MIHGIDVSGAQGRIDWARVAKTSVRVVGVKATEGQSFLSDACERNVKGAFDRGLQTFIYHYSRPSVSMDDADREAEWLLSLDRKLSPYLSLLPCMDLEKKDGDEPGEEDLLTAEQVTEWAVRFLSHSPSLLPVYTYASLLKRLLPGHGLEKHPLWIASPSWAVREPLAHGPWRLWSGHQWTSSGRVDGIEGHVDRDLFRDLAFRR